MRVALDSRAVSDPNGVGRYSRCLLEALHRTAAPGDEVLDARRPLRLVRSGGADVFHATWMDAAILHSPCPMVVTIHDTAALGRRSEHLRSGLRLGLRPLALQRAAAVIAPTQAVAADATLRLNLDQGRVHVVPEAADVKMSPRSPAEIEAVRARFGLPGEYLVWVGELRHPNPDKYLGQLVAAPRRLPLVLVGPTRPWAHELPGVTLTGAVCDDDLAAIYSGARALIVSNHSNGFGLPAVEALACGTPVVACENPALREALEGRARFVGAGDMPALIEAAETATRPAPAPFAWRWEDAAERTWAIYAEAAAAGGRARPRRARLQARSSPLPLDAELQ